MKKSRKSSMRNISTGNEISDVDIDGIGSDEDENDNQNDIIDNDSLISILHILEDHHDDCETNEMKTHPMKE
jgi:hypothetical protein